MRSAHISRRQAEAMFDGLDVDYEDVFAVQGNVARHADVAEVAAAYDLLDRLERELSAASKAELARVPRFTDPRRAGRSRRRAVRVALSRLDGGALAAGTSSEGEAA